ncbi:MAG: type II toxin-antitoxin system VapC family toxin, partial [Leptolyngbya sp. SIO4C1]|nr:type II toxin-antitoxin system VapC family toxin [Leptolyngbya sp. SIO4C1]
MDTSVLNRPFDDQTQPRIALETQALRTILQLIESGQVDLVGSAVLDYENSRNSSQMRRQRGQQGLELARRYQNLDAVVTQRASELEQQGLKAMDALHVSCSEAAQCDYFLTCDDRLMRR